MSRPSEGPTREAPGRPGDHRARGWLRRNRAVVAALLLVVGFAVLAFVLAPLGRQEELRVLTRLLQRRGIKVSSSDLPQGGATFFLPHDLRGPREAARVVRWVRGGGRLVVAAPGSAVLAAAGLRPGEVVGGFAVRRTLETDCATAATVGVRRIAVGPLDRLWEPTAGAVGCFGREAGPFLVVRPLGSGEVVALGGLTPFTDAALEHEDNVVLAWNVLGAPGGPVTVGTPLPPTGERRGVWSLLPPPARAVILQVAVAALLFALARGRRLGLPTAEPMPSPIPATELVTAIGELYRRARVAAHCAELVQRRFRLRVGRRLGLPPESAEGDVERALRAAGIGEDEARDALRPRPEADERELVAVGRRVEAVERRIEGEAAWRR